MQDQNITCPFLIYFLKTYRYLKFGKMLKLQLNILYTSPSTLNYRPFVFAIQIKAILLSFNLNMLICYDRGKNSPLYINNER